MQNHRNNRNLLGIWIFIIKKIFFLRDCIIEDAAPESFYSRSDTVKAIGVSENSR